MSHKKIVAIVLLAIHANIDFAMTRKVVSKLPKVSQVYLPNTFMTTQGMPKASPKQFDSWLQMQKPELQQKIIGSNFYPEYLKNLTLPSQKNMALQQKIMAQQEILDYMMLHPQDAAELMDFYVEIRDVHVLIEERLTLLPEHAQQFFKRQVQKYSGSSFFEGMNLTQLESIKLKILNSQIDVLIVVLLMYCIIELMILFIENERLERELREENTLSYKNEIQDTSLLEVFGLILDALDLEPISLVHFRPEDDASAHIAHYNSFTIAGLVALSPIFFKQSIAGQVKTILHELRHHLQMSPNINEHIVIPADVVQYAKECAVQPYGLHRFMQTGFFWTSAMIEFDADNFVQQHMKDSRFIKDTKNTRGGSFDPKTGYLKGSMWLKDAPHAQRSNDRMDLESDWNIFVAKLTGENVYLKYVPEHLKQAAAKNRAAKAKIKQKTSEEKLLDRYLEHLDQEFAGAVK